MPAAQIPPHNRKMTSIILTILVLSTGLISAALLIILNRPQAPAKRAASACPAPDSAYCEWAGGEDGVAYTYEIIDMTTGKTIKQGPARPGRLPFTPEVGHRYRCTITGGPPECPATSTVEKTYDRVTVTEKPAIPSVPLPLLSMTPTVTIPLPLLSVTQTQTTTPTGTRVSPTPTKTTTTTGTTPTPTTALNTTPTPTTSATGGGVINSTPTPTSILIVQATNTPGPSPTANPTTGANQATATPTSAAASETGQTSLPEAGNIIPSIAVFAFALIIILLGFVL